MRLLVTGGCGFIGVRLIELWGARAGNQVRVIDNLSVGTKADLQQVCRVREGSNLDAVGSWTDDDVHLIQGDILDSGLVARAAAGADAIIHLAASTGVAPSVENPRQDCVTNVMGTLNCLEAARLNRVGRFVFASSGAALGECEPPLHEELPPHVASPYGASKLAGEAYCSAFYKTFGLETVALRFGNVYGPRSSHKNSVVPKFTKQALGGETIEIYGDGTQTRDFVYVDDLVKAIEAAAVVTGVGGEVFQIATNAETSVNELLEHLRKVWKEMGIISPQVVYTNPRAGDVRRNYADTSKARRMLGWQPATSLELGLKSTVKWFCPRSSAG